MNKIIAYVFCVCFSGSLFCASEPVDELIPNNPVCKAVYSGFVATIGPGAWCKG